MTTELSTGSGIIHIIGKERVLISDGTTLEDQLPVDRDMSSVAQEGDACGIRIDPVNADSGVPRELPIKSYILIGVRKQASCMNKGAASQ